MTERNKLSIVTSLYHSAPYIKEFYNRHLNCVKKMNISAEFIFVDDGSPDHSSEVVQKLMQFEKNITLIRLSRNFGQAAAMFAAMKEAKGDYIYTVDSDLEETPENILQMYQLISNDKEIDVVYGVAKVRTGGIVRATLGKLFYVVFDLFSSVKIPHDQVWQRIMSRRYLDSLLLHEESETLPAGLMTLTGYKQIPIYVEKQFKGSTSYSLGKRALLALDGLLSFSARPALMICIFGIILSMFSFLMILILIVEKLYDDRFQTGWLSVIASIWGACGIILMSIGVIGIYIVKIFNQVKNRPRYIVKSLQRS